MGEPVAKEPGVALNVALPTTVENPVEPIRVAELEENVRKKDSIVG